MESVGAEEPAEAKMQIATPVFLVLQCLKRELQLTGRYVLAVSGGADSLALADACYLLSQEHRELKLVVAHVEHGIRGAESLADAALVEDFCRERHLPYYCFHVNVPQRVEQEGLSEEEAARKLRYEQLEALLEKLQYDAILTAHHQDDQAETVLFKLIRGSGLQGLGGMRAAAGSIQRPMLGLTRKQLEAYCEARSLKYANDSTNFQLQYTRNRLRLQLLPVLEEYNTDIRATLARTAQLLQEDEATLSELAEAHYRRLARADEKGVSFSGGQLNTLPAGLCKRILRMAYFRLGGKELSFERTEAVYQLLKMNIGGKLIQLPDRITVVYKKKHIMFIKGE